MAKRKPTHPKVETLRQHGCLNLKPDAVHDELFVTTEFFDPRDLLQVKYEMVRRVRVEAQPINQIAQRFGFSRPTVYQALSAFDRGGMVALLPQRPGPRRAHKLNEEVVKFLENALAEERKLRTVDLVEIVRAQFGISVYPSSVERALKRQEKKRQ